ncbi:molybdenum cofactor cytidylyltransferase [Kaistia hirudinis]|uniref:Molybdenum cofactor cytidylyltransferase n=1 Tax=Kaistia hirudinis TaxID=1293440 RepID=A0A840AQW7_9HYPH|nr:nucleotidyltransferase family protein [Kaistia hirudinis]MBB3932750.1 molybdenum cofactor cytidylyltransferase [Kaistia hirudinis]
MSVAALVLAAGQGLRVGGPNKLLAELGGRALVRRVAEAALASRLSPVVVVTGHAAPDIAEALAGLDVALVSNPAYRDGLSTSLRCGLAALPPACDGAAVLLADMPFITGAVLDTLVATFEAGDPHPIVVPTHQGQRGNPVFWPRRFLGDLMGLSGDRGARDLIAAYAREVVTIEIGEAVSIDLDTPEALGRFGARIGRADGH